MSAAHQIDSRPLSPEMRARIISEAIGTGDPQDRKKRVYAAALEQIRNAEAVARSGGVDSTFYAR